MFTPLKKGSLIKDSFYEKKTGNSSSNEGKNRTIRTANFSNDDFSNYLLFLKENFYFVIILIVVVIICFLYSSNNAKKEYEYVDSLKFLNDPIQNKATGSDIKNIEGYTVNINFIASYDIKGRVINVEKYIGNSIDNKIRPIDIGICWGHLVKDELFQKINGFSIGNRFLNYNFNIKDLNKYYNSSADITKHISNNHLVPSNNKISKLIDLIKESDFIEIKGYLVNIRAENKNGGWYSLGSSTTRTDTGDGACETVYVTNVLWLKEK